MRYSFAALLTCSAFLAACGSGNLVSPATNSYGAPPTSEEVSLASNPSTITYFNVGSNLGRDASGFDVVVHTDGNIYYSTLGRQVCSSGGCMPKPGNIGRLNPVTRAFTELPLTGAPFGISFTPDGALWAAELWSGNLARISPFSASGVREIALPPARGTLPGPRSMTYGADGHVWFTDMFGRRIGKLNAAGPYTTAAITMYSVPNGPAGTLATKPLPWGIATGSDGNIWFTDRKNGTVYKATTTGVMTGFVTPETKALGGTDTSSPSYLSRGSDNQLYLTQLGASGTHGFFDRFTTAGAFTQLPLAPNGAPYLTRAGMNIVAFADHGNGAIGVYNTITRKLVEIPTTPFLNPTIHAPAGVAVALDRSIWFTCNGPVKTGPLCIGHLTFGPVWSIFPGTAFTIGHGASASPQLIGIAESGNSGPFTATSSNIAVAKVSAIPSEDHNFLVTGIATGSATITVKDVHARTVPIFIKVN